MFPEINKKDTFNNVRFLSNKIQIENYNRVKSGKKIFKKKRERDFNIGRNKKTL